MARVSAAAREADPHSGLFRWMERRHDWLAADIAEHGARWAARCREWAALGVLDGKGRAPGVGVAKETWRRVVEHVKARRERAAVKEAERRRPVPALRDGELVPCVRPTATEPTPPLSRSSPESAASASGDDPLAHIRATMAARSK